MTVEHTDSPIQDPERLSGYMDGPDPGTWRTYLSVDDDAPVAALDSAARERNAQAIQRDVCSHLSADPRFDASGVVVSVSEGEVILEGLVQHARDRDDAQHVAERVAGVNRVHNRLEVHKGVLSELRDLLLGDRAASNHAGSGTKNPL